VSGQVEILFSTIANVRPYLQGARLKVFAVTSARRSSLAPELPTVQEAGIPGYDIDVWFGLFGPAGLPRAIVEKLNREINAVLAQPEVRQTLETALFEPASQSPDAFAALLRRDVERFARMIRSANIKAE